MTAAGATRPSGVVGRRRPSVLPFGSPMTVEPLRRFPDREAELPRLRAQLRRAERQRDVERERVVAAALARALIRRRSELDIAVRLARRAVLLGDDGLRIDLATWHCQLGQTALAVGMLAPLLEGSGLDRSRLLVRIALYWARLDQPDNALAALREAAAYDPNDPLAHELQGAIFGWAPSVTSPVQAAEAYLRGAARRRSRQEPHAAFEDALRAFDAAPEYVEAAQHLASVFRAQSQETRALEVERRHARALSAAARPAEARSAHLARLQVCLDRDRLAEALAAALEAGLDASIQSAELLAVCEPSAPEAAAMRARLGAARQFDWLLRQLGLVEWLAARLELAAEAAEGSVAARCYIALGQLLEEQRGASQRAAGYYMRAALAGPGYEPAWDCLRGHARKTGDHGPWIESLLRVVSQRPDALGETHVARLEQLRALATQRAGAAPLALWCAEQLTARAGGAEPDPALRAAALAEEEQLRFCLARLESASGKPRVDALREAVSLVRYRPGELSRYQQLAGELLAERPGEARNRALLERALWRAGDRAAIARWWTKDLVASAEPNVALTALLGLSRLEREAGNLQGALAVLAADDNRGLLPAAGLQLSLAAQLGHRRLRADALLKYGKACSPAVRAWLSSIASGELLALGESVAAMRAAEIGTRADPSLAAPLVAYADAAIDKRDRVVAVACQRAMELTFPSAEHCRRLVTALHQLGDHQAAQVWTSRWLGMNPSATEAAVQLLDGALRANDLARLGDVLAWAIAQAHPLAPWAKPLSRALRSLLEGDRSRAVSLAWRLLDTFGPQPPELKEAVAAVAEQCEESELQVAVLERSLAADVAAPREELLWQLSAIHRRRGDVDRCLAVLVRALGAGVAPAQVLERLRELDAPTGAEGLFHQIQIHALAHELQGRRDQSAWAALREHGAALWDLAGDRTQAFEVWLRAAEMLGEASWLQFVLDLVDVMGLESALDEACVLAQSRDVPEHGAALLSAASHVALREGRLGRALQLALLSLDSDPGHVAALQLIEASCPLEDPTVAEGAYRAALGATLGKHGERALHYRAARFFELRADWDRALEHATAALVAIPSEGTTFATLLRLSRSPERADRTCRVLAEVAGRCTSGAERSAWLRRAALVAVHCDEGALRRCELLLRALVADPQPEIVDQLGFAFGDLGRQGPEELELGQLRLERIFSELLPRLASSLGSRVAIALAGVSLECFGNSSLALRALAAAVAMDCEVSEYSQLLGEARSLCEDEEAARSFLMAHHEQTDEGLRGSVELLDLALEIAAVVAPPGEHARLLVRKVQRVPSDERTRQAAEEALRASRESNFPPFVLDQFPLVARQAQFLARAEEAAAEGDATGELQALAAVVELDCEIPLDRLLRMISLAAEQQQLELAERGLEALAEGKHREAQVAATTGVAMRLLEQRRPQRALKILLEACDRVPDNVGLLTQALSAARAAGEDAARQWVLDALLKVSADPVKRGSWFNEAWEVARKLGDQDNASRLLREWLEADPKDGRALSRLQAEHEAKKQWPQLARLLEQQLSTADSLRERRRLSLRLGELLVDPLGDLPGAQKLLGELLERAPADRTVVERYAEISERLGEAVAAAEAWFAASGLSATRPRAAELAERACELFLGEGEHISARRVLAAPQAQPRTAGLAKLAVRLEREGENQPGLARALEELAHVQKQATEERAAALLEAAELWRKLGEEERARSCAVKAAGWLPTDPKAQVLASSLEFRRGGMSESVGHRMATRLARVISQVDPADASVATFLLTQALLHSQGPEQALAQLRALDKSDGSDPLLALARADCLQQGEDPSQALPCFDTALAGDLMGFRDPDRVALQAARVAFSCGILGRAHRYLQQVEKEPECLEEARQLRGELEKAATEPVSVPASAPAMSPVLQGIAKIASAIPLRGSTQLGLGRKASAAQSPGPGPAAEADPEPSVFRPLTSFEGELFSALQAGEPAAGRELVDRLLQEEDRAEETDEVLGVWWRVRPGDAAALSRMIRVAETRGDSPHAAALHNLQLAAGASAASQSPIPPLSSQPREPELVRALILHDDAPQLFELLGQVWHAVHRQLDWERPDAAALGRPLSGALHSDWFELIRDTSEHLGLPDVPIFLSSVPAEPPVLPVMNGRPTLWLRTADAARSAGLLFELGRAVAHLAPGTALFGCGGPRQIEEVFRAIHAAFGPPKDSRTTLSSTSRLAAALWEGVTPAGQRQLKALCEARQMSAARASSLVESVSFCTGLYLSGDVELAIRLCCRKLRLETTWKHRSGGLADLCQRVPIIGQLVRLAARRQFAHLRYQPPPGGAPSTRRGV